MFNSIPLIIVFPVLGLLLNLFWGRRLGEPGVAWVACGAAAGSFAIALLQAVALFASGFHPVTVPLADWIVIGDLRIPWAFQVDTLSVTMMLVVSGVGFLIHVYAVGYMHEDVRHNGDPARYSRFFVYLNLFLAAMLVLVTANNYGMMFVGWEGVGLCSYLLIGFWFEKGENHVGNARAARKAFVVNRIGDWAFLLALFLIFWRFGSLTFEEVFGRAGVISALNSPVIVAITLLLLVGAAGKSAQVPLYVWLPDAMAGPTPVSALIHAATMVTAGIYMITRSHLLYFLAPISQQTVTWVGAITALFAATIAVAQFDIKKVLAYSTISQLGFMVAAVGLGAYAAGMFHLVTHAFFKALLFLSAGSVIQALERGQAASGAHGHAAGHGPDVTPAKAGADPQDMRAMGGLWGRLPVTQWVYVIGALALAGLPPLSGFFSKDEILLDAFERNLPVYGVLTVAAFLTAFYMGRQLLMVFAGQPRSQAAARAVESPAIITTPLVLLALLAALGGLLNLPGLNSFSGWLGHTLGEVEALPFSWLVAGVSTALALAGLGAAYGLYRARPQSATDADPLRRVLGPVFTWMSDKWYVDELYFALFIHFFEELAAFLADRLDARFWHDWFHDRFLAGLVKFLSRVREWQAGYVRRYALAVFLGVVVVLGCFVLTR